jgi:hypothetical protein
MPGNDLVVLRGDGGTGGANGSYASPLNGNVLMILKGQGGKIGYGYIVNNDHTPDYTGEKKDCPPKRENFPSNIESLIPRAYNYNHDKD